MPSRRVTSYLIERLLFSPTSFWLPLILLDVVSWIKLAQTSAQTLCSQRLYRKTLCWEVCSQTQILFPGLISQADEAPSFSLPALGRSSGLCRDPWTCPCWKCCEGAGFILPWHIFQPTYRCVQWGNGSSLPDGRIDNRREPRDGEGRIRKTGNVSSFWTERGSSYMTGKRPVINCGKR